MVDQVELRWQPASGIDFHRAAMSGRPILAFGVPRYGFNAPRHALVYFETGHGWREANTHKSFDVTDWQPLSPHPNNTGEV